MIGYITIGSNDLHASGAFYDDLLAPLHASRAYTLENMIAYSFGEKRPMLVITRPNDGQPATCGNGTMIALLAPDRRAVQAIHRQALDLGAANAGDPAPHGDQFYGGYIRDPDNNKICVFVMG